MSRLGVLMMMLSLLLIPRAASGQETSVPIPLPEESEPAWVNPSLPRGMTLELSKPRTILRLKSGEWVQGELQHLEDENVEMEGDKTADKTYDYADVVELHSTEPFRLVFVDEVDLRVKRWSIGEDGWLLAEDADGKVHRFLRVRLIKAISLYGESDSILKRWRGSISLSFSGTFGNTRNGSLLAVASLTRQIGDWRFTIEAELAQGRSNSEENEKSRRGRFQIDYDLSLDVYLTLGYLEGFYDKFQNIELRLRGGSGVGYRLIRRRKLHWVAEATGIGTYVQYRRVEPNTDRREVVAQLRLATRFWAEFLDGDIKVDLLWESFLGLNDIEDTTHHCRFTLSYEIVSDFTIDFTVIYDRNESPEPLSDGTRPKRDDVNLSLGFGWKL